MKRILVAVSLALVAVARAASAAGEGGDSERDVVGEAVRGGLLDPAAPLEKRMAYVAEMETIVQRVKDPFLLYVLGSLYRQGEDSPAVPVTKDLDRAREYLSRAALSGSVLAMAKLSAIESQAKNRFEANVWAQLHFHYGKELARLDRRIPESFAASVLGAAQDGFADSQRAALNDSVGMMISTHDAAIMKGVQALADRQASNPLRTARGERCTLMDLQKISRGKGGKPASFAMAEFYLSFSSDGSVDHVWALDGWPDAAFARAVRPCAMAYRVEPAAALEAGDQLAMLPVQYSDQRHRIRQDDGT